MAPLVASIFEGPLTRSGVTEAVDVGGTLRPPSAAEAVANLGRLYRHQAGLILGPTMGAGHLDFKGPLT